MDVVFVAKNMIFRSLPEKKTLVRKHWRNKFTFNIRPRKGELYKSCKKKGGKTRLDDILEEQELSLSTSRIACLGNECLPQCGNDPGKRGRLVRLQWA